MGAVDFNAHARRATSDWHKRLRAFRASHAPRSLRAGGHEWTYLVGGQGPRVALLLHGSESDAESLFGAMTLLEQDYTVLAPTIHECAASVEQVCAGLVALLTAECQGAPALVVGYSLGGYLAQALAERRPDLTPRLALCNTGGPALTAVRMVRLQYSVFAATPGSLLHTALRAGAGLPLWRESPGMAEPDLAFWRAYLAEMSDRISKRAMLAHGSVIAEFLSGRAAPPDSLANQPGRVLILDAEHDHVIEPEERAALRACYPLATQRTLPSQGHLSMLTRPDLFVSAIHEEFGQR